MVWRENAPFGKIKANEIDVTTIKIGGTPLTGTAGTDIANVVIGVASGYKVARGSSIGTDTIVAATGLTTITGFALSTVGSTGTKVNAALTNTGSASVGNLTISRWKATGASTTTLIASTVAGTVSWVAIGT